MMTAQAIDDVLAGTFPASDPPSWTPGMARPAPAIAARPADRNTAHDDMNEVRAGVIDVSRPTDSEVTFAQALVSLAGAVGLVLLVPLAILAVGTPLALAVRGVLEIAERLLAIIR
jgi:hypothetical protein